MDDLDSNNWVVSRNLTLRGYPMMANDPHRRQAVPSLRYIVHMNGLGWNVMVAGSRKFLAFQSATTVTVRGGLLFSERTVNICTCMIQIRQIPMNTAMMGSGNR